MSPAPPPPHPIATVVFDAYGTLLDVHSAVARHAARCGPQAAAMSALWRVKQLEASWIRSATDTYEDFASVTEGALDHAMAAFGLADAGLRGALLAAYHELEACPDAALALHALRARGVATAVLSNGSPAMLAAGLAAAGLARQLDAVLSVHAVRRYKPDPAVYALATARFGVPPGEILFVSANAWDAYGARCFGFRVAWVNRAGGPVEYGLDRIAHVVADLRGVPGLLA